MFQQIGLSGIENHNFSSQYGDFESLMSRCHGNTDYAIAGEAPNRGNHTVCSVLLLPFALNCYLTIYGILHISAWKRAITFIY